jgi:hypothetical protein
MKAILLFFVFCFAQEVVISDDGDIDLTNLRSKLEIVKIILIVFTGVSFFFFFFISFEIACFV